MKVEQREKRGMGGWRGRRREEGGRRGGEARVYLPRISKSSAIPLWCSVSYINLQNNTKNKYIRYHSI